ncbi:MAG: hypothetical protein WCX86_10380, partial [Candidatus Hydrogenedentales bacterium]
MKFRVLSRSQLESWERAHAGRALGARRTGMLGKGRNFTVAQPDKRFRLSAHISALMSTASGSQLSSWEPN